MARPQDTPLEYRTALTQIERAIVDRLALAFQERLPAAADFAALRKLDMQFVMHRDLIFVEARGTCYFWQDTAKDPDNGGSVIAPDNWIDAGTGKLKAGRWTEAADQSMYAPRGTTQALPLNQIRSGYARTVMLYAGKADSEDAFSRIFGRRPAMLVAWKGTKRTQISGSPALFEARYAFDVYGISYCPRFGPDALYGSELPEEAAEDPGLNQILSDASDCLVGASDEKTDYCHLVPGVDVVLPGDDDIVEESLGERLFVGATSVEVVAYLHRPDYDAARITNIHVDVRLAAGGKPDAPNSVGEGLKVAWPQAGLRTAIEGGWATINAVRVAVTTTPVSLPPNSDIYRDLKPDGTWMLQHVPAGDPDPPKQQDGTLRVGVTTTDGGGVVFDRYLCSALLGMGYDDIE